MRTALDLALACLVILTVSLQKTYASLPIKEIKRRARTGDRVATLLHRAVSYGRSLRAILWLGIIGFSTAFFFIVSRSAPTWFALTASVALIWVAYVWLPASRVTVVGERTAALVAPLLARLLNYLHPLINRIIVMSHGGRSLPSSHTKLYEKADLLDFLNQQQQQADNRIDKLELDIAKSALTFGDQIIRKRLTPRRMVQTISVDDAIGPVLMDELHKSGHSRFPVHDGKKDNIVGTLYMRDLVDTRAKATVGDVMKPKVSYVHEEQSLYDALQAVIKTHHHLLVVVNSFEEYVGIITLEDILEQIVGKPIIDEFDQYQNLRAVAARAAKSEHEAHEKASLPEEDDGTITSDEQTTRE
ncbi:CBS domain-containing protein [Candidatus Saccharibacteria bacterium]|nr:CBS domain-containing protein [Candidatus Saccharibacteria bacterium]